MSLARTARLVLALACGGGAATSCAADPGDAPKSADSGAHVLDAPPAAEAGDGLDGLDGGGGFDDSPSAGNDSPDPLDGMAPAETATTDSPSVESSVPDAPPDVETCTTCPLVVEYSTPTTTATTQEIRPHVQILNNGASDEDLTVLTLRYWYTADGSTTQAYDCDYAAIGCGVVQATFVAMTTPTATADHYMEVSFTGGTITAGTSTGEIQTRFHDTSYAVTFTQTNDYSFDADDVAYTQWSQITLYRSGTLVWGAEPQ